MSCRIRVVLAIHNHQPIGNFEHVFEAAFQDSYAPFLDVLQDYPEIPISLHTSGSLLEWLSTAHPEYLDRIRGLVDRGQIEILGGPFYEPILAGIPRRDRIGQITAYSEHLERLFGARVRGMWVPERVWEHAFTGDIVDAGIDYTILDDFHFRSAGLSDEQLHGYYITEDEGRVLKVFPGSERLRYTIPFADPHVTIDHLREIGERCPDSVVVFGDDGEKFGTWPGTKKHVYEDGWLRRFLETLRENSEWLKVVTLAEAVEQVAPLGTCFLPDCSYREMTEWALPTQRQLEIEDLKRRKESDPDWIRMKRFFRGGFWRNFRVKYPETNEMYTRMLEISRRLETLCAVAWSPDHATHGTEGLHNRSGDLRSQSVRGRETRAQRGLRETDSALSTQHSALLAEARRELYRGQCNCSYWHGAFGGLYLPHLRNAVYKHLIAADSLAETIAGRTGRWVQIDADDYNLDARKEVRLAGDRLVGYLAPSRGGHLYELDVRATKHNLLATLNRRSEPYHETVRQAARHQRENPGGGDGHVASIHETVRFKQPDLDKKLIYDQWPRKSLVDHFLQPGLSLETFQQGRGEIGDFVLGVYETRLRRSDRRVEACMIRSGQAGSHPVKVTKTVALDAEHGGALEVTYELDNLPPQTPLHFGVEFNFAGMAAGAPDRYFYDAGGQQLGPLESVHALENTSRIGLTDEWLGLDAALDVSEPAGFWTFPIQTISQSEGGFELVHQSTVVMPHWEFTAPQGGRWTIQIVLSLDTSVAQARQLGQTAAVS